MSKSDHILRELRLPDAINCWERRWGSSTKIAEMFKFWRFRYFVIITFVGVIGSYKNTLIMLSWIFLCCLFDYIVLRDRAKRHFKIQLGKLKQILRNSFYKWDIVREDTYHYDLGSNQGGVKLSV